MRKTILVITSSIDVTVDYIEKNYFNRLTIYRVNIDQLASYQIIITDEVVTISNQNNQMISLDDVDGILYRKPLLPDIRNFDIAYHEMIQKDIIAVVNGIVDSFEGRVLTKPSILRKCENKIYQLIYAKKNRVLIPESFIGNSTQELSRRNDSQCIIKPITTGKVYHKDYCEIFHTSYFNGYEKEISLTPVYVQKYVKKRYEVRLTVVDKQFFGVKIMAADMVDWRKSYQGNKYEKITIPIFIKKQVLMMMKEFDLHFGAFDYIVSEDEKWYFLEVNPNGQWLWLDKELDLKISDAIVDYLLGEESE